MKKIIILSAALALMLAGCATVPKCPPCPPENTLFMTQDGLVEMPKGFFDTGKGQKWMHTDDFEKQRRDAREKQGGL